MPRKPTTTAIVIVLMIFILALIPLASSYAQQQTPPHLHRDPDTGLLLIDRAPASVLSGITPLASSPLFALQVSGMAAWSNLTYQSYIGNWDIFAANGDGTNPVRLTSSGAPDITPRFNRGATRIAFASSEPGNYEIFAMNTDGSHRARLTNQAANDYGPAWSPNGTQIVFNSYRDGQSEIYVMNADGSNQTRLTYDGGYDGQPVWSPNGTQIAFLSNRSGSSQIWVMNTNGSGVTQLTTQPYSEDPAWSPDGTQIAYDADADYDGWQELMVVNADGTNPHVIGDLSTAADMWARSWSPDGRSVAFTAIYYIYYQGNWYWTAAYSRALDTATSGVYSLGGSNTDWFPDWQTTDLLPPTSSMTALPTTSSSLFSVQWSGVDAGPSGILAYDIQVRDGITGTWTTWRTRTSSKIANYSGIGGHTYFFRVRAIDNSNNTQAWPANPQTSTTVESLPPVSTVNPLPTYQYGDLAVSWGGSDPGGSGVRSYDVQVRDGAVGAWTDWITNTPSTMATFTGISGHIYSFHVRATDWAQNLGGWSDVPSSVTFYTWQLVGQVRDARGYGVVDAQIILSPTALNVITSTSLGYLGYGALAGEESLEVAQPGYGVLPPMNLSVTADRNLDQFLTPKDDVIVNGDFETDFSPSNWIAGGLQPPILTTTINHTGQQAALLGRPFDWTAPINIKDASYSLHSFDMTSDPFGNLYLVWKTYGFGGSAFYTTRPKSGVWSIPVVLATYVNWEWQGPAIAADTLGHVYVAASSLYQVREPDGTWTSPSSPGFAFGPQLLVDRQNTLHAMWDNGSGTIYYASKPIDGNWSNPVSVGGGVDVRFDIGEDGSLHAIWTSGQGVGYATKSVNRDWSPQIELSSGVNQNQAVPDISVDLYSLPHVVWRGPGNNLFYTHKIFNGSWTTPVSITLSQQGLPNNPAIIAVGNETYVAYFDAGLLKIIKTNDDLHWQTAQSLGPAWGGQPKIALDDQGLPQIVWQTDDNLVQSGPAPAAATGDSWLMQTQSVPVDMHHPTLSFLYQLSGAKPAATWLETTVASELKTESITLTENTRDWTQAWLDLQPWAGQIVTINVKLHETMDLPGAWAYIDDVSLGSWLTPNPEVITPTQIPAKAATVITITGDNFLTTPQVRLNDVALSDVTWINTTTLTVTVPMMPFGHYDLSVTNPGGQASGLSSALLVGSELYLPIVRK